MARRGEQEGPLTGRVAARRAGFYASAQVRWVGGGDPAPMVEEGGPRGVGFLARVSDQGPLLQLQISLHQSRAEAAGRYV